MIKLLICGILILGIIFLFILRENYNRHSKYSKIILPLILLSIIINIAFAHNYVCNMVNTAKDIYISNFLAYFILGKNIWAPNWSLELFKNAYNYSLIVSLVLVAIYIVLLFVEQNKNNDNYIIRKRW